MAITWSFSRDRILRTCERRYYFQYIVRARINSRDTILREIALLKKLKSIPMWKGDVFHSVIADYLRGIRRKQSVACVDLLDDIQTRMTNEWRFSENMCFRSAPRAVDQQGGLALFEHEYDEITEVESLAASIQDVKEWFCRFNDWATENEIRHWLKNAKSVWIEPPIYGTQAPGFRVDGVQVLAKVDFAFSTSGGEFKVFDWKTGAPPARVPRHTDDAQLQICVYQLWPNLALNHPVDNIKAHLVYVSVDPAYDETSGIDENMKEHTLSFVRRSIKRMRYFSEFHSEGKLNLDDFDFAAFVFTCRRCPFKGLCRRILGNE